ncbi:unnamed protein product [Brassicogethes aeneus]|uniref:Uncharacterized protein n=1 Tax=Brassicogethes aeneus TaxID=1431903 RepID=A0A9P0FNW2_BRAAE|nr:unnamed protein product [Brassicogethes aeneus]
MKTTATQNTNPLTNGPKKTNPVKRPKFGAFVAINVWFSNRRARLRKNCGNPNSTNPLTFPTLPFTNVSCQYPTETTAQQEWRNAQFHNYNMNMLQHASYQQEYARAGADYSPFYDVNYALAQQFNQQATLRSKETAEKELDLTTEHAGNNNAPPNSLAEWHSMQDTGGGGGHYGNAAAGFAHAQTHYNVANKQQNYWT